ncbi:MULTISPECIES: enoyl-CoA hydratase/isomerase family protein [unclassified Nocardioides]|uniref:enoyl-CoA hydratase/isomerase family protein n=1 Tax=unclassified Nocardioides TaxID=2615069 RepID=UPI0009F0B503|nr:MULTISPECIES: enoyl-CoA hydratase-related protein [unclassified Nocardioides]GAW47870.1 Short chain enoyl-CoA hydratase [Nocardioides sp. PD653-B2]GAW53828.1 Short chain enoyl-CoA hydratase [Nocardioides sp. PD653]
MNSGLEVEHLEGHVASIQVRRPPVNALSSTLIIELGALLDDLLTAGDARVVILSGHGGRFCAGFDINELLASDPRGAIARNSPLIAVLQQVEDYPLPVIAAIERYALGGGCELAMACDVRVSASDALIGLPEINLGGLPGLGGMQRMARLVSPGKAKQLVLTGSSITGEEAWRIGLVDEVTEPGGALGKAYELAKVIASRAPLSVRAGKRAINAGRTLPTAAAIALDLEAIGAISVTEDRAESLRAFVDKRAPTIVGR